MVVNIKRSRLLTFMAYSWPSSCPLVFLTRNTFP